MKFPLQTRPTVVALLFGALIVLMGCNQKTASAPASSKTATPLQLSAGDVAQVKSSSLVNQIEITGTLEALKQTQINAPVDAEVAEVLVRPGMPVKQGDVLLRFNGSDLSLRLNQQKAQVDSAQAQLNLAQSTYAQQKALLQQQFISKTAFDNAANALSTAQAQLKVSQAQLALAQKQLNDAVVRAPFAAQIAQRFVEPGQRVAPNSPLFKLVDPRELELSAAVASDEVGRIAIGQAVELRVEGMEDKPVTGTVTRIAPAADSASRRVPIYVHINNADAQLRAGLFAHGTIAIQADAARLAIPDMAIHKEPSAPAWVWLVENNRLKRRNIVTGTHDNRSQKTAVTEGLALNDWVLIVPGNEFTEGQPVALNVKNP